MRLIEYDAVNVSPPTASSRASSRSTSGMPVGSCETVSTGAVPRLGLLSDGTHPVTAITDPTATAAKASEVKARPRGMEAKGRAVASPQW